MSANGSKFDRRHVLGFGIAGLISACDSPTPKETGQKTAPKAGAEEGSLDWALAGPWRIDPHRDVYRHPAETVQFFQLAPSQTIVEVWPGRGWWTSILAPWLTRGRGRLIAAHFDPVGATEAQLRTLEEFRARFLSDPTLYGATQQAAFGETTKSFVEPGTADRVLTFRNIHNFMAQGFVEKAFRDFFAALKPGGLLGIEEHRASARGVQDPLARSGYVQEAFVKELAISKGFEFVASSEINANPLDTRDHPYGVWTLPPVGRTSEPGQPPNDAFDRTPYDVIGESDRMTLLFRKPVTAA
jgi:predicted methyltransferase